MNLVVIEGFVRGAAVELTRGIRINLVSPAVLEESFGAYAAYSRRFEPVSVHRAALACFRNAKTHRSGASIAWADERLILNGIGAKMVGVIFTVEAIPKTLTFGLQYAKGLDSRRLLAPHSRPPPVDGAYAF